MAGVTGGPRRPRAAGDRLLSVVAAATGLAAVLGAGALYAATAARDIVFGDSPELTGVALTLGVAHPPGYPLYTMIGWLFGQLPVGPLPFRIALLSVVAHAATVGVIYAATLRFTRSAPAAAVSAAALATAPLFWAWSLVPEVFPLNDLLSASLLLLVAMWHERPQRRWLLVAAGLAGGLGVANHQTIVLLAPAVAYVLWRRRDDLIRDPGLLRDALIAFVVGLTPYLELLVAAARQPLWSWGDLRTVGDLVNHFLRAEYGSGSLIVDPRFQGGSALDRILALLAAVPALQWVLVVAGSAYAWRTQRWYATYLGIAFVVSGPAFAVYSNADIGRETTRALLERFFLLPQTVVAPLAGFAVVAVADLGRAVGRRSVAELSAAAVAIAVALATVPLRYGEIDQSANRTARTFANDVLSTLRPDAIFFTGGDALIYPLWYLQTIEGARPDVAVVAHTLISTEWYVRELARTQPRLVLTNTRYGPGGAPVRDLIDANRGKRPLSAAGDFPDTSTRGAYWYYSRGLIYDLRPVSEVAPLDVMAADNESAVAAYRPPSPSELDGPFRTWERLVRYDYAHVYYRMGKEYENNAKAFAERDPKQSAGLYDAARRWYRRALEVDPTLAEARQDLTRLGDR